MPHIWRGRGMIIMLRMGLVINMGWVAGSENVQAEKI